MDAWHEERVRKLLQQLGRIARYKHCVLALLHAVDELLRSSIEQDTAHRAVCLTNRRAAPDTAGHCFLLHHHTQHRQTHRMSMISRCNTLPHSSIRAADLWWHRQPLQRRMPAPLLRRVRMRRPSPHLCQAHPAAWWITCQARGIAAATCAGTNGQGNERPCAWPRPVENAP